MLKVNHDRVETIATELHDSAFVIAEFANYFSDNSATEDKIRFIKWIRDRYSCNLSEAKYAAEQTYSKVWDRRVAEKRVASYCQQSYGGSTAVTDIASDQSIRLALIQETPFDKETHTRNWVNVHVVSGVEGVSLSINDCRVTGPKPWGGGRIIHSFKVSKTDLYRALCLKEITK